MNQKNWMPKQPVSKKYGLLRHPVSPKGVLLRLKIENNHLRSSYPLEAAISDAVISQAAIQGVAIS